MKRVITLSVARQSAMLALAEGIKMKTHTDIHEAHQSAQGEILFYIHTRFAFLFSRRCVDAVG